MSAEVQLNFLLVSGVYLWCLCNFREIGFHQERDRTTWLPSWGPGMYSYTCTCPGMENRRNRRCRGSVVTTGENAQQYYIFYFK